MRLKSTTGAALAAMGICMMAANAAWAQTDAKRGEKLFDECKACHVMQRGVHGVGPSLYGVMGRAAGAVEEFRYSPAMRRSGIVWDVRALDAYLADPQKAIPANRMPYAGMPAASDRADVIDYLGDASR